MRKNLIIALLIFVVILFGCQKENRDIKNLILMWQDKKL